jgi:mannosyl-3-phosphoglycerate phosphatase
VIEFGNRYHLVVEELRLAARELDIDIVSFSDLAIEDVARELGIPMVDAQLAKLREYTELFRIVDDTEARRSRLYKALRRRGLRCWWTGSHHLVTATPDRSESLRLLKTMWQGPSGDPIILGLGDSDDDVGWLSHADVAVVVQDHRTGAPVRVLSKLPTVRVTRWPGRRGWSEAVVDIVNGLLGAREPDSGQRQWPVPSSLGRSIQPS